jgi:hypothetical protein
MSNKEEALKLALEELAVRFSEGWHEGIKIDASDIMLLNEAAQALAQLAQEPVLWTGVDFDIKTTPPQRPWVGLTDEEAQWLYDNCRTPSNLIDMVEAKLKEKNT